MRMSFPRLKVLATLMAAGCCVSNVSVSGAGTGVKTGDAFPDLAKYSIEGQVPSPDALRGKVVLVDFWASWCGPCKGSFPVLEELHQQYGNRGLVVVGVNLDETSEAMREYLEKHKVTFTILRDREQKLVKTVGIASMPSSFLLDGQGKVRFVHNGFHGAGTKKQYIEEIEGLLKSVSK
jgi:thiol-disulfide isomerase/thioredoxin